MTLEYDISAKTKRLTAKEWFVDLRFLGYEDTPIVDGVPEGWKKVGLDTIAPIVTGKKMLISELPTESICFLPVHKSQLRLRYIHLNVMLLSLLVTEIPM